MKKLYQKEKYKRYSSRVARKSLKHRLRRKKEVRAEKIAKLGKRKKVLNSGSKKQITAPVNFSLLDNPNESVLFISDLEKSLKKKRATFVNLEQVENIDHNAITLLLSVMYKFKEKKISFNGNFPSNLYAKNLLIESDFFVHLNNAKSNIPRYIIKKENQILTQEDKPDPTLCEPIIKEATKTVWGKEKRVNGKGLFRILIELMHNTDNHASKNISERKWWLSINHHKHEKKVCFTFLDYGVGIFSSLNNKDTDNIWYGWQERIKDILPKNYTNRDLLRLLLDEETHLIAKGNKTSTGESYRGKGIPGIKGTLNRRQISKLYIITNNVYADVLNNKYEFLKTSFSGTLFYWEFDENNDTSLWDI